MRNVLCTLFILFLVFNSLNGQQKLSLSAGVNHSSLVFKGSPRISSYKTHGYFVGLENTYFNSKHFEVSSEIQYSSKAFEQPFRSVELKYLDLINLLKFKPIPWVQFYTGINTGYLLDDGGSDVENNVELIGVFGFAVTAGRFNLFSSYNFSFLNSGVTYEPRENELYQSRLSNFQLGLKYALFQKSEQSRPRPSKFEIGIRTTAFKSFEPILKFAVDEDTYYRFSVVAFNLNYSDQSQGEGIWQNNFGLNFGVENRIEIDRIQLLHGFMYGLGYNFRNQSASSGLNAYVGYLIGAQYPLSQRVNVGIELIPNLSFGITNHAASHVQESFGANINIHSTPTFFATYNFNVNRN